MLAKDEMVFKYGNYRKYVQGTNVRLFQEALMMLLLVEDCNGDPVDEIHIEWLNIEGVMYFKDALYDLKVSDPELTAQSIIDTAQEFSFHSLQLNGELPE